MKYPILIILVLATQSLTAQIKTTQLIHASMSLGKQSGLQIRIPEADEKQVWKAWEDFLKDNGAKTSKIRKHDELLAESVTLKSFGEFSMDIYSAVEQTAQGVMLKVYFKKEDGFIDVSQNATAQAAGKTILANFARQTCLDAIDEQIKEEEKNLKKLNKEKEDLVKDQESYESDIKDAEELISKRIKQLEQNASNQEIKEAEIATQNKKLEEVKAKLKAY